MNTLKDIKGIAILVIICILGYLVWDYRGTKAENEKLSGQVDALSTRVTTAETRLVNYDALIGEKLSFDNATRNETARDRGRTREVAKHDPDSAAWLRTPIPQCLRDGSCLPAGSAASTEH